MSDIVLAIIGGIGLFVTLLFSAYAQGYNDAKEKYDNGIIRYDLTK